MIRFRNLALIGTLIMGVLLAGTPAQAATVYPPPTPSASPSQPGNTISITVTRPGGTITITITGFISGETIIIVIHSTPVQLGSVKANSSGGASASVVTPADLAVGSHTLTATGVTSGHVVSFPMTVDPKAVAGGSTGSTPGLSNTGVAAVALSTVAGIFLIGGIAFTFAGRRRNDAARTQ
jgi:hypothetical protein